MSKQERKGSSGRKVAALLSSLVLSATATARVPEVTQAFSSAPGWVVIAYQHPGGDGVRYFYVEQRGAGTVITSPNLADTFEIKGLSASTRYEFRVCAQYEPATECTAFFPVLTMAPASPPPPTPPAQPKRAPEVTGVGVSGNSVSISWNSQGGNYTYLLVRLEDQLGHVDQRKIPAQDGGSFTFPGMRSSATYYLLMKGCTDPLFGIGGLKCGPWSERREVRTYPSAPPSREQTTMLRNQGGLCLDIHRPEMLQNGGKVQAWECNGDDQQRWMPFEGSLRNLQGLCLDVHAPDMQNNGARVQVWECNGRLQQQWQVVNSFLLGPQIVGPHGRCLDVHAPDMRTNGARVQLWECNLSDQQKWQPVR